jgi:two-component system chemotaxis response regulator CheB
MSKIRVVVVDDSALIRSMLTSLINSQPDMECVGAANDPYQAREMIRNLDPDVITLDVEMPRMDGLDFLEKLMRLRPMPVVMVSTLTERGAETTLRALELGAVDFVAKPRIGIASGLQEMVAEIADKLRIAARARISRRAVARPAPPSATPRPAGTGATAPGAPPLVKAVPIAYSRASTEKLIAIGSSTGGTEALREVLTQLPADCPAVLCTQHMPPGFTKSFADRLNSLCRMHVKEAEHGERVLPGHVYIAPGGRHMLLARSGANYVIELDDGPPVNRHKPSVDVLFRTVARHAGANAMGVMLTGMGRDGADAMKEMRDAGAHNIGQDEATSVVYGMPREAAAVGAVHEVLPLPKIAGQLLQHLRAAGPVLSRV